jgi:hypothetical protein
MFVRAHRLPLVVLILLALAAQSSVRLEGTVAQPHHLGSMRAGQHHSAFMQAGSIAANVPSLRERMKNPPRIRPTIDGSKTPALIPDSVAYGHFIRATASATTNTESARREHFLAEAGLEAVERAAYVLALGDVGTRLDQVRQQRRLEGSNSAALQAVEIAAVEDAENRIRRTLSPSAMAKVDTYVREHIKRRIKTYSGPMR